MDKPRDASVKRNKKIRRALYIVLAAGVIAAVSVLLARMRPAAPTVERATMIIDTVKQGELVVTRRGMGTLVPEDIQVVSAETGGRVIKRLARNGMDVTPDTVILELSSPETQQLLMDAELALKSAESAYKNRQVDLESQLLTQKSQEAAIQSQYEQAQLQYESYKPLADVGLYSDLMMKQFHNSATDFAARSELEKKRTAMISENIKTQMSVAQSTLDQARVMLELRKRQADNLRVKAGLQGILQELLVEVGQSVQLGTPLARVSDPKRLRADIKITETQARDIQQGQKAEIDTRNGFIQGRVSRVDPSVVDGTRKVEVTLLGDLPPGAVPSLNVDGTIELFRLPNVLKMQRPAFGQENSTVRLFRMEPDDIYATAVTVQLGQTSVTEVEVRGGLKAGDRVIVSDTSQLGDNADRIRLN
ncbi:MAG TPA: efflux RND transporter periplasmic adaptor subunit [Blastocatellia bacterium]